MLERTSCRRKITWSMKWTRFSVRRRTDSFLLLRDPDIYYTLDPTEFKKARDMQFRVFKYFALVEGKVEKFVIKGFSGLTSAELSCKKNLKMKEH